MKSSWNLIVSCLSLGLNNEPIQNDLIAFGLDKLVIAFGSSHIFSITAVSHLLKIIKMMINLGNFMTKMILNFTDLFINVLLNGEVFDALDKILGSFWDLSMSFGKEILKCSLLFWVLSWVQSIGSVGVAYFESVEGLDVLGLVFLVDLVWSERSSDLISWEFWLRIWLFFKNLNWFGFDFNLLFFWNEFDIWIGSGFVSWKTFKIDIWVEFFSFSFLISIRIFIRSDDSWNRDFLVLRNSLYLERLFHQLFFFVLRVFFLLLFPTKSISILRNYLVTIIYFFDTLFD